MRARSIFTLLVLAGALACGARQQPPPEAAGQSAEPAAASGDSATAIFAGGCFWCMEKPFDELPGVLDTTVGYTGGHTRNPSYEEVSAGGTGHMESVRVTYDPARVSYGKLLEVFWHNVDPTDASGQFCDRGSQYGSAIFYQGEDQKKLAEASKKKLEESGELGAPIVTRIRPAAAFYPAEGYHQDFYRKNPVRYRFYRAGCGRDARLRQLWGEAAGH